MASPSQLENTVVIGHLFIVNGRDIQRPSQGDLETRAYLRLDNSDGLPKARKPQLIANAVLAIIQRLTGNGNTAMVQCGGQEHLDYATFEIVPPPSPRVATDASRELALTGIRVAVATTEGTGVNSSNLYTGRLSIVAQATAAQRTGGRES